MLRHLQHATTEDFDQLWELFPKAKLKLENIILERQLREGQNRQEPPINPQPGNIEKE